MKRLVNDSSKKPQRDVRAGIVLETTLRSPGPGSMERNLLGTWNARVLQLSHETLT